MAHIAIDARIINSSTGRYVERLLHYLETIDTTNVYSVLVRAKDEYYWKPTNPQFTVRVADFDNYSIAEQTHFKTFLDNLSADLVHFCMPQQPVGYKGRKVTTFHDLTLIKTYNSDKNWLIYRVKQLIGKQIFKKVARASDHIIAISQYTKKDLQKFTPVPDEKISVIYESGETSSNKSIPHHLPFSRYILYVGQQSDYKNIPRLAAAHQKLLASYPDLGLVLVGNLNAAARKNKVLFDAKGYKNIVFTDFVEDTQLNWLYENTAAYIFPSLMEGFGLPGLEAMAHGAPVISSNATCLPEIYGEAALYFNPEDIDAISLTIGGLIENPDQRLTLIEKGYQQVKKYSWATMAQETLAVYESVLTNSPEK
jgi:glycosyltransferase involved in cell wall biosynthesis